MKNLMILIGSLLLAQPLDVLGAQDRVLATQAARASAELTLGISDGKVSVDSKGVQLSKKERARIKKAIASRLRESWLPASGGVKIKIRGAKVARFLKELRKIDLEDDDELEDLLEKYWEEHDDHKRVDWSNGERRVVMGQSFEVAVNEELEKLVVIGSKGIVRGKVERLILIGSQVTLEKTSSVTHKFISVGSQLDRRPGSKVSAQEVNVSLTMPLDEDLLSVASDVIESSFPWWLAAIIWFFLSVAFLVLAAWAYDAIFPKFHENAAAQLKDQPLASAGAGFLALLAFVPMVVFLVLTILGIMVIPVFVLAFGLLLLVGYLEGAYWLIHRVNWPKPTKKALSSFWGFVLGLAALRFVGLIPLLGELVSFVVMIFGFGAVLTSVLHVIRDSRGGGKTKKKGRR